jgi:hypothetical protein
VEQREAAPEPLVVLVVIQHLALLPLLAAVAAAQETRQIKTA